MVVWGRKWLTGYLSKKGLGDDGKVVEGEYDIQGSKTGVILRSSDTTVAYGSETWALCALA